MVRIRLCYKSILRSRQQFTFASDSGFAVGLEVICAPPQPAQLRHLGLLKSNASDVRAAYVFSSRRLHKFRLPRGCRLLQGQVSAHSLESSTAN